MGWTGRHKIVFSVWCLVFGVIHLKHQALNTETELPMTNSTDVIRRIAWREIFPWLILLRTFRIAISPILLVVATAAVLIAPLGWSLGSYVFLTPTQRESLAVADELIPRAEHSQWAVSLPQAPRSYLPLPQVATALLEAYFDLAEPLYQFFRLDLTLGEAAYYAFGFL